MSEFSRYVTGCDIESTIPEVTLTTDFAYPTEPILPTELPTDVLETYYNTTVPCSETPSADYNGTTVTPSSYPPPPSDTPAGYSGSGSALRTGPMAALVGFLGAVVFML